MQWIRDKAGVAHPEDSWLLAYTRWQPLDDDGPLRFHQHLQQCSICQKKCEAYVAVSGKLGVLAQIQARQRYETAFSARVLENIDRQKKSTSRREPSFKVTSKRPEWQLGFFSVFGRPIAVPLALFCIFLLLLGTVALAYSSLRLPHMPLNPPTRFQMGTAPVGTMITRHLLSTPTVATSTPVVIPHTPTPGITPTPQPSRPPLAATPTTAVLMPTIVACSNPTDVTLFRMRICGSGFTPGDMVALVIDQPQSGVRLLNAVNVDGQGNFEETFLIQSCHNVPFAIYAQDQTDSTKSSGVLQNIIYGDCPPSNGSPGT